MPVYVAYNYKGIPIDVVFAMNDQLATAYWHGKDVIPHNMRQLSDANLKDHPTGVLPIVTTKTRNIPTTHLSGGEEVVVVVKP